MHNWQETGATAAPFRVIPIQPRTPHINIIRTFSRVARVNIFMRIYTNSSYIPSIKWAVGPIYHEGRGSPFLSASQTQRIFTFGGQADVSPRAKTGRGEQCEYITVFDAKTKRRATLLFVFYEDYIEMRHAKPPVVNRDLVPRKSLTKHFFSLSPSKISISGVI